MEAREIVRLVLDGIRAPEAAKTGGERPMIQVLRRFLAPYRRWLAVLLLFQAVQATTSLVLPSLNADIIDKGVMRGDTGRIWSLGVVMLGVTAVQAAFAIGRSSARRGWAWGSGGMCGRRSSTW